ncbi:MAG: hypothetical protein BWY51_00444 [Parcubacteria group bacterium ADurb.Bin316]|nr:MAG: hypothetical protein BWY51_00444 [Parcubacteria group bacterium ADurb.Bin316]HOZ56283.1 hypothetical protein [bacterium]
MNKKIKCLPAQAVQNKSKLEAVRVRVIKAPLVDTNELRQVIMSRARALVL